MSSKFYKLQIIIRRRTPVTIYALIFSNILVANVTFHRAESLFCYTVVNCGILTPPIFGAVVLNQTSLGAVAVYACLRGYQLLGNSSRTCQANGEWSDGAPLCKGTVHVYINRNHRPFISRRLWRYSSTREWNHCCQQYDLHKHC